MGESLGENRGSPLEVLTGWGLGGGRSTVFSFKGRMAVEGPGADITDLGPA